MLTSILLLIIAGFLFLVSQLFSLVSLAVPTQIATAFDTFFDYVHIFDGFFPISDFLLALLFLIALETGLYLVKIFLFGFSLLPWVGSKAELPGQGNTVDLSHGRVQSRRR